MILCWIILIVGVIAAIVGGIVAYIQRYELYSTAGLLILMGIILVFIGGVTLTCCTIEANQELNTFICQKEYIEDYEPTSEYDTAAILSKKLELNEWLYEKQYVKERRPICSFYGDEILEIEPIK